MTVEARGQADEVFPYVGASESRRIVAQKVAELVVAAADALEAQEREDADGDFALRSMLREGDADPGSIRELVDTPIYRRLAQEYVAGDGGEHLLSRVTDLLRELAPRTFGRPQR